MANQLIHCKICGKEMARSAKVCPNCGAKNAKPFYLKWWFILIVVLFLIGFIGSLGDGENSATGMTTIASTIYSPQTTTALPTSTATTASTTKETTVTATPTPKATPTPTVKTYKSGMYKIGVDMPAGEYYIVSNGTSYFQVTKDSTGTLQSIICNDNFSNNTIITVSDGQYLSFTDGVAYAINDAPSPVAKDGYLPEGMYMVGIHLSAGEYKVKSDGSGYIEVSKTSKHTLDGIVTNDIFEGEKYITLKAGQYIKLNSASIKVS